MTYEIIREAVPPKIKRDRRKKENSAKQLAMANGEVRYFGEPCGKGHIGWRYTKGSTCVDCIADTRGKAINPRQRSTKNHKLALIAAENGNTTYVPAKPCKNGHMLRFVNSNNCVECDKLMLEKHKITQKFNRIIKLYKITKEEYLKFVVEQNNCCKICNLKVEDHFKLHVDHCHDTGKVRGLLCPLCNQGIGLFNHNSELLRKAALYCE